MEHGVFQPTIYWCIWAQVGGTEYVRYWVKLVLPSRSIMDVAHISPSTEAKEIMTDNVTTIGPNEDLIEASKKMFEQTVGALPVVVEDNELVGIITERDICRILAKGYEHIPKTLVRDAMTRAMVFVQPEETLEGVIARMSDYHYRRIPVVKNGKLVGIISQTDLLNHYPEIIASGSW